MMKKLVRHGNGFAIPIDKATLSDANLDENSLFQLHLLPWGGLCIQSIQKMDHDRIKEEFDRITREYDSLFKRLSDH